MKLVDQSCMEHCWLVTPSPRKGQERCTVALRAPLGLPTAQSCSEGLGPPDRPSVPPGCGRNLSEEGSALSKLSAAQEPGRFTDHVRSELTHRTEPVCPAWAVYGTYIPLDDRAWDGCCYDGTDSKRMVET